jgi:hypothetical protein
MDTRITIKPLRTQHPTLPWRRVEATSATEEQRRRPTEQSQRLSPSEIRQVDQLKRRDREVRRHELSHKAIAGQYARGAPSYEYRIGPDGRRYAVGGEVSIDTSKANDPRETLRKAEVIRNAAMAPADPSMQDRQIALQASAMAAEARHELQLQEQREKAAAGRAEDGLQTKRPATNPATALPAVRRILSIYQGLNASPEPHQNPFEQIA